MKKSVLLMAISVLLLLVVFSPLAAQDQPPPPAPAATAPARTIRFISDLAAPPFAFKDGLETKGFEIDLGEAIAKELGAKAKWVQMSFNISMFESTLVSGGADAVLSSLTITDKRKESLSFTRPYFRSNLAVATLRDVDWDHLAFKNGLKGMRVGVMRRSTGEEWARKNLKATRVTYDSPTRLARALKNGDVHVILIDEDILQSELASRSYKFKIVEKDLDDEDYGIAVKKGNTQLLAELNSTLEKLDADGTYDDIYAKWFQHKSDLPQ